MAGVARGAGYAVSLDVSDGTNKLSVHNDSPKPQPPDEKRPSMAGHADAQFTATWKVARRAKDEAKDVLVHFYVVRLDRAGQAPPALAPQRVPIESALTMDFPPGHSAGATLKFRVDQPGIYLVRVETRPGSDDSDHEDFAAMELAVK